MGKWLIETTVAVEILNFRVREEKYPGYNISETFDGGLFLESLCLKPIYFYRQRSDVTVGFVSLGFYV